MKTTTCPKCKGLGFVPTPDGLRDVRLKAHITLKTMADRIGISAGFLCDIEFGRRSPPDYVVAAYNELTK